MTTRIVGLDLIRTLSFVAIVFHHFTSRLWYAHSFSPFEESSWYWRVAEVYSRTLSFSGYTILFLTSFLIAYTAKGLEKARRLIPLMLVAWVLLSLTEWGETPFFLPWDIFPLIASGLGLILIFYQFREKIEKPMERWLEKYPKKKLLKIVMGSYDFQLFILGFIMLSVPFWQMDVFNYFPFYIKHILVGDCENDIADWPILPWMGLIFCGFSLGRIIKENMIFFESFSKRELGLWMILLCWTPLYWGSFYRIQLGDRFGCEVSRQEPQAFMAHWFWIIGLIRISFLSQIQMKLNNNGLLKWISSWQINQHFGLAYIMHLLLIEGVIALIKWKIYQNAIDSFCVVLLILPLTEVLLRAYFQLKNN